MPVLAPPSPQSAQSFQQQGPLSRSQHLESMPKKEGVDGGLPLSAPPAAHRRESFYRPEFHWVNICSGDCPICQPFSLDMESSEQFEEAPPEVRPAGGEGRSLGSAGHEVGECRPCAFFWRTASCNRGELCAGCHLCPPGTFANHRRAKRERKLARSWYYNSADVGH
eukprot:TRINITY_DN25553_c0_g1_i2.p2 TRINITY_DN25553_c0_g1~~TRINITY_DN25553_c0_g1_i2.p2  ORF type:complete len:167 (+),score=30.61 TRINITY_DN25553_c0_g1_i2:324-824(+)